jgi:hypothetical protein
VAVGVGVYVNGTDVGVGAGFVEEGSAAVEFEQEAREINRSKQNERRK